jgi:type 1 glutamine amidotransferase
MKKTLHSLLVVALLATPALSTFAAETKRVIVCTVTTGFRHSSIPFAEKTLQKLGEESGAYTIVDFARQPDIQVPRKPNKPRDLAADADENAKKRYASDMQKYEAELAKWTPEIDKQAKDAQAQFDTGVKQSLEKLSPANLKANKIDGVIFANTTGDLPLPDKEGFIQWVKDGHAFMGMHSASDTFHQFDGYKQMIQAEFRTHGKQVPADLVAGDTEHPANGKIGATWNLKQEEMYEFKDGSHDRSKVRALWFLRHPPQDTAKSEYAGVSWCRMDDKGRVFYTSLGHREDLWSDDPSLPGRVNEVELSKQYQAHILGGIKWALGLVEGNATPNPDVK